MGNSPVDANENRPRALSCWVSSWSIEELSFDVYIFDFLCTKLCNVLGYLTK